MFNQVTLHFQWYFEFENLNIHFLMVIVQKSASENDDFTFPKDKKSMLLTSTLSQGLKNCSFKVTTPKMASYLKLHTRDSCLKYTPTIYESL